MFYTMFFWFTKPSQTSCFVSKISCSAKISSSIPKHDGEQKVLLYTPQHPVKSVRSKVDEITERHVVQNHQRVEYTLGYDDASRMSITSQHIVRWKPNVPIAIPCQGSAPMDEAGYESIQR